MKNVLLEDNVSPCREGVAIPDSKNADSPVSPETIGDQFRRLMPITSKWAYLDNAAVAPLSAPAHRTLTDWARESAESGDTVWLDWARRVELVRQEAAALVGADPEEIAFVANTSGGINLVAEGYPWSEGDNVVTLANEFPSNQYPWMNLASRGVETRRVPVPQGRVDLDRLADACDDRTRMITLSWVGYASGWRVDVAQAARLAHDRGALFFLDAIQGLGVFPLDVRETGVDFFAADGHKWMLGPEGAGIFFVRREHLEKLRPVGVGWNSVVDSHDFCHIELRMRPTAARYEGGSQNMPGVLALGASLQMLAQLGVGPRTSLVGQRVLQVTDYAGRRLAEAGAVIKSDWQTAHRSGIVAFDVPGCDLPSLRQRCLRAGVVLSYRGGNLRISPHGYASETDIERLVQVVESHGKAP
jgi:selenocysteine lyase/cysteine desulfurase